MSEWIAVEKTATGPNGEKMAFVDGTWQPADGTATGPKGEKMARLKAAATPVPAKSESGVGETPVPTAAGAAGEAPQMNQQLPEPPPVKHSLGEAAANVGVGAAVGAGLSAIAPEALMAAGGVMAGTPLAPAAPFVIGAGEAMRVHRTASILSGALTGAVGAGVGEGVRAAGGSEKAIMVGELAGGMLTPTAAAMAKLVPGPLKTAWQAVQSLAAKAPAAEARTVAESREILRGQFAKQIPEHDVYTLLKAGGEADVKAAEQQANDLMTNAYRRAEVLGRNNPAAADAAIAEAKVQADAMRKEASAKMQRLQKITDGKMASAEQVLQQAAPERAKIGAAREVSDIGTELQTKTATQQSGAIEARRAEYQQLKQTRDATVAAREQQGEFLDQQPGMRALKDELNTKLLTTAKGREASTITLPDGTKQGVARVNEPGVERAYQSVLDTINNKRVQTGVNAEGNPTYQTFKTTFEALDHVRRKLGDAGFKGEKEGYGALGQGIAKDLYTKIAKIQEDYAGPAQKAMQSQYAARTGDMAKFETAAGRKMTAVDRMDPEVFAKDPAAIPSTYFKSQQGVRDLLELTGDPVMVERAAKDFTAKQLGGMSAQQVQSWAAKNTDWTREVPGLQKSVAEYATRLQGIEKLAGQRTVTAEAARTAKQQVAAALPGQLEKVQQTGVKNAAEWVQKLGDEQTSLVMDATKLGQKLVADTTKKAADIVGKGYPVEDVRKLLLNGSKEEVSTAMRYMSGSVGGATALEGAVRHTLATVPAGNFRQVWDGRLKQAMLDGRVLTPEVVAKLDSDIQEAFRKFEPAKAKTLAQKYFQAALVTVPQVAVRKDATVPEQSKKLPWQ